LTAARTGEVIEATWSEIDGRWWVIPRERMKNGEEYRTPLSGRAIEILQDLPRKGERIFPRVHEKTLYRLVTKTFGLPYTTHGFRSSFGDWCTENDVPAHLREVALAHQEGKAVVRAYVRSEMLEMRRSLAERWSAFYSGVVPLRLVG
jgi:integrase